MARMSEYLRKHRTEMIRPFIGSRVLDLGCGFGTVLRAFDDRLQDYCGIENQTQLIESLEKEFPNRQFLQMDLNHEILNLQKKYDTIIMLAVIEHILNLKHVFEQMLSCLEQTGRIIMTTPTPWGDRIHRCGSKVGVFAASADHHHIVILNKHRLFMLAKQFSLKVVAYKRFSFGCNQLIVLSREEG